MSSLLLAGDIGGTKTRLSLVRSEEVEIAGQLPPQTVLFEQSYPSQNYQDFTAIVREFFAESAQVVGFVPQIRQACLGIAGPIVNNSCEITNLNWPPLVGEELATVLNIPQVILINDFTAIGYGVLGLAPTDLYCLQDVPRDRTAPIAVLGAGTGLGEGFLIPQKEGNYRVFPSEGSHADFAARSPLEFKLLQFLKKLYQVERISTERIVSGMGIATIYQFLREEYPGQESPELAAIYQAWQQQPPEDKTIDLSAEIAQLALKKGDRLCEQTLNIFVEAYGVEAGNLALKLLPYGGLYIAGGIAPKILPLLKDGRFLEAFQAKGRMRTLMLKIPLYIVLNPQVGLRGAALRAAQF
ncbi:MAG: glucokinase [Microcystaceae cyanobacterium]